MAYCKGCGAPVRERDTACRVCGREIEQIETIDKSLVEIVHAGERASRTEQERVDDAFVVFDKRVTILFGLVVLMQILAFAMDYAADRALSPISLIGGGLALASACVSIAAMILRRRRLLVVGIELLLGSFVLNVALRCFRFDFSTGMRAAYWVCSIAVSLFVGAELATVLGELLTQTRHLGLHTALICLCSIAILAHVVVAALGELTASIDPFVLARQIFEMLGKIFLLCTILSVLSNLGRLAFEPRE